MASNELDASTETLIQLDAHEEELCQSDQGWTRPEGASHTPYKQASITPYTCPLQHSASGVLQEVREHYLRDDIFSGTPLDPDCPPEAYKLSADAKYYLVVDTNIVLHQVLAAASRVVAALSGRRSGALTVCTSLAD